MTSCVEALGMHSGDVLDSDITASSSFGSAWPPQIGRLHYLMGGTSTEGSWAAALNNAYQWLQMDTRNWTRVTGVATQGKQDEDEWVESYSLSMSYGEFFEYVRDNAGAKKVKPPTAVLLDYM